MLFCGCCSCSAQTDVCGCCFVDVVAVALKWMFVDGYCSCSCSAQMDVCGCCFVVVVAVALKWMFVDVV